MAGWWLGPAGALTQFVEPSPGAAFVRARRRAVHRPAGRGGQATVDDSGRWGMVKLSWSESDVLTADEMSVLESLYESGGPYRLIDGSRRNYLTANQSEGTDPLHDATGFSAFTQGTVLSSTAQARTGQRSLAWNTVTALGSTGRGVRLMTDATAATPDGTWAACLPSTSYVASAYLRTSAAVSMQIGINYYDNSTPPVLLSSPSGSGVALSTSIWTRIQFAATSDATAAYAIPKVLNTTTTGAAITVYLDDAQLEEGTVATAQVTGIGTPVVDFADFAAAVTWLNPPLYTAEALLEEIG
jgi:hypothetical protein